MAEKMRCGICGESISMREVESGNVAEMHDPKAQSLDSDIVHAECGLARGWEVS